MIDFWDIIKNFLSFVYFSFRYLFHKYSSFFLFCGYKQGRFPAWLFAFERMSIFAENCVCCKNLILLRFFETLQHFFNSISLYSPPKKDLKFPLLKLLTLLKIIDIIISIVNISFNKNKPSSACGFGLLGVYNIIIVNGMSSV